LEINPFLDANGNDTGWFVNPPDAGYKSNGDSTQIVWSYKARSPNAFYSNFISGCQRQPNGNTLICSGAHGHFFEVTEDGEVVWEYQKPERHEYATPYNPKRKWDIDRITQPPRPFSEVGMNIFAQPMYNIQRCNRYSYSYPGWDGLDTTPKGIYSELGGLENLNDSLTTYLATH